RVRAAQQRGRSHGAGSANAVTRAAGLALALAAGAVLPLVGQEPDVAAQLGRRTPPEVVRAVQAMASSASAKGLPAGPLIQKAIEGAAKGVPAERVIGAVRALADQLEAAAGALRSGGIDHPDADVVEGGAYALGAGLNVDQVRELVRTSHAPYDPAVALRVAATLAALGVSPKTTLDVVEDAINTGRSPSDLLDLPSELQARIAHGATPAQAARHRGLLERQAAPRRLAQDRRGAAGGALAGAARRGTRSHSVERLLLLRPRARHVRAGGRRPDALRLVGGGAGRSRHLLRDGA